MKHFFPTACQCFVPSFKIQGKEWQNYFFSPRLVLALYLMDPKQFACNLLFKLFAFPVQQFVFPEELRLQRLSG